MSRAVQFDEYGPIEVLRVADVEDPVAGEGELLVRVRATSINPGEAKIRDGAMHSRYPASFPSGQGSDVAGVVERLGSGVDSFSVGDEIIGWTDERAAHAQLATVQAAHATRKPSGVSWEVAGSLYVAGATAWAVVRAVDVAEGDTVVVAGAAGGVGVMAVQLLRGAGATVIGLASERHHEWLRAHGVVPVTYGDGVADRIADAATGGVDAFVDLVGGGYVDLALQLGVAPQRIDTVVDFGAVQSKGVKAEGNAAGASAEVMAELAGLAAAGQLDVPIAATYPLERVRDAFAELEQGHMQGKIVLLP